MDVKELTKIVDELKQHKKNFVQSIDFIAGLKELNLKNPAEQVEFFIQLPYGVDKKRKICALIDSEMLDSAKEVFDKVILLDDFDKLTKKDIKKLAKEYDFFVGQANIMPKIAQKFGRVLGPRGKMPNPKAGCVVPPKVPLKPLYDKLQKTVKISVKKQPNVQVLVGKQNQPTEEIVQNVLTVYDQLIHHLPKEKNNIKSLYLKTTMSKPMHLK